MLSRPNLNELVPGYEVLVWMDSDAWAQQPDAVLEVVSEADRHGMAAVPEIDRGYFKFTKGYNVWELETRVYDRCFGGKIAEQMKLVPVINSGFWAARANLPLWSIWQRYLREGLSRLTIIDGESRVVEQAAFNVTIKSQEIPVRKFPATYNWLACLALPAWHCGRKSLVDPNPPYDLIRILHISTHLIGKSVRLPLIGHIGTHAQGVKLTREGISAFAAFIAKQQS
jgi:hypothetical protein